MREHDDLSSIVEELQQRHSPNVGKPFPPNKNFPKGGYTDGPRFGIGRESDYSKLDIADCSLRRHPMSPLPPLAPVVVPVVVPVPSLTHTTVLTVDGKTVWQMGVYSDGTVK